MSLLNSPNINYVWSNLLTEELIRNGIDYFCISPGSRSTPLTVAVADNPSAKSFIHYDERGLAFHALGYTSATKKPCVLICTSGTAAANFLPAIVEASKKKLPLVILTADRPPELRYTGANQTIDQVGLFKNYVRFEFDMPCPTLDITPEFVLTTIDHALYRTRGNPPGPVHLNCMFREPLEPTDTQEDFSSYYSNIRPWINSAKPFTRYLAPQKKLDTATQKDIAATLKNIKHGIIAVGKLTTDKERAAVLKLSKKLNWPIFPDITSGLRMGNKHKNVIHYFDQVLLSTDVIHALSRKCPIDGIIQIGGRISSKRWYEFVEYCNPKQYLMVLNHPLRNDPLHNVTLRVESNASQFCDAITPALTQRKSNDLISCFAKASALIHNKIKTWAVKQKSLTEPTVARLLSSLVPPDSGLFLASSLPIREMDMYAANDQNAAIIGSNRGASGIDGTIASAAGFAKGLDRACTLLIGDLAFLHDINSLSMLKACGNPFVLVVLNNNGGGIFSFLPIADFNKVFETYFGTPHNLSFSHAAKLFGLNYTQPKTEKDFIKSYKRALKQNNATIIEVSINRNTNYTLQQDLQSEIKTILQKLGKN